MRLNNKMVTLAIVVNVLTLVNALGYHELTMKNTLAAFINLAE